MHINYIQYLFMILFIEVKRKERFLGYLYQLVLWTMHLYTYKINIILKMKTHQFENMRSN